MHIVGVISWKSAFFIAFKILSIGFPVFFYVLKHKIENFVKKVKRPHSENTQKLKLTL